MEPLFSKEQRKRCSNIVNLANSTWVSQYPSPPHKISDIHPLVRNPLSDKIDEKLKKREERYDRERRFRTKSSEDLASLEEVFDNRTLLTILKILNIGKLKEITGVLKAGKESRVYHGLDPEGKELAVKIFLTSSNIFRQGRLKYIEGDPRFKDIPHDTRSLVDMWALKEYKNLELAG